jgi:hypothetical protein
MSYIGSTPTTQVFVSSAQSFNGDDLTVDFTLDREIATTRDLEVLVENVQQDPFTAYTVSGNILTFTEAPPTGTGNIIVTYRNYTISKFVPEEDSIQDYMLQANSVTTAAIAGGAVQANNLADTAVSSGNYGGADQVPSFTVDAQGRLTYAANVSIETGFNPFLLAGL